MRSGYSERAQSQYEHAWEIRDLLGFRDFTDAEQEIIEYVAPRVATTQDSRWELFDRAVPRLIERRVLLRGITTLSRLVTGVRRVGLGRSMRRWRIRRRCTLGGS